MPHDEQKTQENREYPEKTGKRRRVLPAWLTTPFGNRWVNYGCLFILVWVVGAIAIPSQLGSRRAAWASRAKGTLRSIGSTELAYQSTNNAKVYGSFKAMKDAPYIAEGYTLGSMIENYSMSWQVNNISTVPTEQFPSGNVSTFTVIAWPRDRRRGFLSTFGVTEDQTVRVYTPKNGNRLENVKTWDPIL